MYCKQKQSSKKLISIVVPVYNEEDTILNCYNKLCLIADTNLAYDFEFIFSDNSSTDSSYAILQTLAQKDPRLLCYSFSKNIGYQKSIYVGLLRARGNAAIAFDCDLQDPPELLPEFIAKWESGYKVVYGIRTKRNEPKTIEFLRKCFYRFINLISEDDLPLDAGDFRLLDRCILDLLAKVKDYNPYLRGTIANFGFKQTGIPYIRQNRKAGKSKFNLSALIKLSLDGIISQSVVPLRFATYTGLTVSLLTLLGITCYLFAHWFFKASWPAGFTTLAVLILFSTCLNALFLGIIGEYLARIYNQVRTRPVAIIEKSTPLFKNPNKDDLAHVSFLAIPRTF